MISNHSNLAEIHKTLIEKQGEITLVSFDVFDTLVRRAVPNPDVTKTPVLHQIRNMLANSGTEYTLSNLLELRLETESTLRQQSIANGKDPECRIDDVFSALLVSVGIKPSTQNVDALLKTELEAELSVAQPVEGMLELITDSNMRHFEFRYVSDSYLLANMIEQILDRCGYAGCFGRGYVSCEESLAKYSGRLFKHMIGQEKIKSDSLVHIGDNPEADVEGPGKAQVIGLQFINNPTITKHATQSVVFKLTHQDKFWEGAKWQAGAIGRNYNFDRANCDTRYQIGYAYLGPLFANFIHQVLNRALKDSVDMLLFCSREGFLLERIYSRICASLEIDSTPEPVYSYLNRKSVYPASLHRIGAREIDIGFDTTTPTIRNFLGRFSLSIDDLREVVMDAGISDPDRFINDPAESTELRKLLDDERFISAVKDVKCSASDLLKDYLGQIGFWNKNKVALVDVGWNGTTQEALAIAFERSENCPQIAGYYMALLGRLKIERPPNTDFHGVYFDYLKNSSGISFSRYVELFETVCRAPHPTVTGFSRIQNGRVEPSFLDSESTERQLERQDEAWIASIQSGILDYCENYTSSLGFRERTPEEESDFILFHIDRLLRYPTKAEARVLTSFSHSEGFGLSMVHIPGEVQKKSRRNGSIDYNLRTLWREGRYAMSPVPGLNVMLNFFRVLKTSRY